MEANKDRWVDGEPWRRWRCWGEVGRRDRRRLQGGWSLRKVLVAVAVVEDRIHYSLLIRTLSVSLRFAYRYILYDARISG